MLSLRFPTADDGFAAGLNLFMRSSTNAPKQIGWC